jgi:uncharacterized protein YcbX
MGMAGVALTGIATYPVKSLAGGAQTIAMVEPCGLEGDRRFMVVDAGGRFISQRECPRMALLHAALAAGQLILSRAGAASMMIAGATDGAVCTVRVWRDAVTARDAGETAASWLSAALDLPCRLVYLDAPFSRRIKARYASNQTECVSFADGFPLLLASESSLAEVNARLPDPVTMARFRPNLVIAGGPAWAEDTWRRIRIGEAVFRVAKPCDRCVITTLDPLTGLQPAGNEPLTTLAQFRRDGSGGIMFGQNLVPERCGAVRLGDRVEVLEAGPSNVVPVSRLISAD